MRGGVWVTLVVGGKNKEELMSVMQISTYLPGSEWDILVGSA